MLILIALLVALPSMASADVVRDAPTSLSPDAEFNVTLTISGIQLGGVVETLPSGFTFVSTSHPWYNVSGQRVAFALANTTTITYTVKAPSAGDGTFEGWWEDLLSESNGTVAPTTITIQSSDGPSEFVSSASVPVPSIGAGRKKSISLPSEAHGECVCFQTQTCRP